MSNSFKYDLVVIGGGPVLRHDSGYQFGKSCLH